MDLVVFRNTEKFGDLKLNEKQEVLSERETMFTIFMQWLCPQRQDGRSKDITFVHSPCIWCEGCMDYILVQLALIHTALSMIQVVNH